MDNKNEIIYIKLSDIVPNRYQPRIDFDEESLNELIISIKNYGIIEPLVVRQLGDKYELIAGERRYKAASRLGITEVPAIIKNVDDNTSAELALIENLQRKDLNAYEEAKAYEQIINMNNITQEQLASKIGKSQGNIANKLRLLSLPDAVQAALARNSISERHARSLLKLNDRVKQVEILNKIINERLNVKDTDEYIKSLIKPDNQLEQPIDNNLEILDIEDNKENNTVNLQELNINNDNLDIANNNELQIKEKMEINMNQEQNNNQMPNMNFEIQPNQGNSRFFPPLENQTTNMNFNQSLNIPQNQSPVANNFDTNMVEPQMIENNDMITNSLIFNPGQTVNANQDNIVNQQEPITPFVNMNIPTNNSTLTNGPQPITEMPNNFVQSLSDATSFLLTIFALLKYFNIIL